MTGTESVADLERLSVRTWPPLETGLVGDWMLGASRGFTRRANSCNALGTPGLPLDQAVAEVESWYRGKHILPCVKISPATPDELDARLESLGWYRRTPAEVLLLDLAKLPPAPRAEVVFQRRPDPVWLERACAWEGRAPERVPDHAELLSRMVGSRLATVRDANGAAAGTGVAVLDPTGDVFLYDLAVDPARRRRGLGRDLLLGMLRRARGEGARRAVLQVVEGNAAATALYASLGFGTGYRYHYREFPDSASNP